jgi:hypothetical protein
MLINFKTLSQQFLRECATFSQILFCSHASFEGAQKFKLQRKNASKPHSFTAYKGVKARRKFFQEAAAAAAETKPQCAPAAPAPEVAAAKDETKKRYEEVKNFFRNMEQNSEERREHFFRRSTSRRCSDTMSMPLREAPQIVYMSCRVKKAKEPPPHIEEIFDPQESRKVRFNAHLMLVFHPPSAY